jgi:hypothetical protein
MYISISYLGDQEGTYSNESCGSGSRTLVTEQDFRTDSIEM